MIGSAVLPSLKVGRILSAQLYTSSAILGKRGADKRRIDGDTRDAVSAAGLRRMQGRFPWGPARAARSFG